MQHMGHVEFVDETSKKDKYGKKKMNNASVSYMIMGVASFDNSSQYIRRHMTFKPIDVTLFSSIFFIEYIVTPIHDF